MSRRRLLGGVGTIVVGALVALVVAMLAGFLSVAATHGTSMLPRFRPGDLAVLWAAGSYRVGQIVAYQNPLLHATVLHRIVSYRGGLFTFKGDNNAFVDPVRLPASAIKGTLLLHIPRVGAWLLWLKGPSHLVLVLAALLALLGVEAPTVRWRTGVRARRSPRLTGPTTELSGIKASDVALPLAVALAFGAIAGVAWSRPEVRQGTEPVPYHEQMSFGYTTPVTPSMVYPDGVVRTGQPIFLNLVSAIKVTTHFSLTTTGRHAALSGRMAETVDLVYGTGWSTLLEAVGAVPLRSSQGTITVPVDLTRMAHLLAAANKTTGVEAAMPTLVVNPVVTFSGRVSGQPVSGRYAPSLSFNVNDLELSLAGQAAPGSPTASSPLQQSQAGSGHQHVLRAATMTIMGRSAAVSTVRYIGEAGVAASMAIALAGVAFARRRSRQEESAQIRARYGHDLIGVRTSPAGPGRGMVDVVGISALAKVAKAYGALMLDHHEDGAHSYYVDTGTMVYRYRPGSASAHQAQYQPGHHKGGADPVISRLSQHALRTSLRGLSPSPWTFGTAPLSARHEGEGGPL